MPEALPHDPMHATIREIAAALAIPERTARDRASKGSWAYTEIVLATGAKVRSYPLNTLPATVRKPLSRYRARQDAIVAKPVRALARPLSAKDQERLDRKLAIVNAYRAFESQAGGSRNAAIQDFAGLYNAGGLATEPRVRAALPILAPRSLLRWVVEAETAGVERLAGRYGNRAGSGVWDNELAEVRAYLLAAAAKLPDLSCAQLRRLVAAEYGERVAVVDATGAPATRSLPPLRTVQKLIADWRAANPSLVRRIDSPDDYKNRDMLALGDAMAGIEAPNDVWMIDASPTDVIATDGRHQIYLLIDVYTRRIMVLVTRTPRTEAVKVLLRGALLAWGVPRKLVTDNGSDFVSKEARRVLLDLLIQHDPSTPFSPWEKPFVERAIGTLQHGLFPLMPGYCGHNVAAAQRIRARRAFAARLGEKDAAAFEVALSAAEIQECVTRWVRDIYSHTPHAGLGRRTPAEVEAASRHDVRAVIEDERALDMLLVRAAGERRVGKKGLRIQNRHYWDPSGSLIPYVGSAEPLDVRMDPEDPSRVYVYRADPLTFIGAARCLEMMAPDERAATAVAARALQARTLSEQARTIKASPRSIDRRTAMETVLNAAAIAHEGSQAPTPATMPYSSPALEAAASASRALPPPPSAIRLAGPKVVALKPPAPPPVTDEDRWWQRARDIEARQATGQPVSGTETDWINRFRAHPAYRARARVAALAAI
jgi:putative transposase